MRVSFGFSLLVAFFLTSTVASAATYWPITRTEWTLQDEQAYSNFVSALGRSKCSSFDQCIHSSANMYRGEDPPNSNFYSDCADLPYMLRAYFAWRNGLPMSVATPIVPADPTETRNGEKPDLRYTSGGNKAKDRADFISIQDQYGRTLIPLGLPTLKSIRDGISSASYRMSPDARENQVLVGREPMVRVGSDFYSVSISRGSVRPGTVIYDPAGHVAVVYSVENDGRVLYMDAHPDDSITRGTFGKKFVRARPAMGAGFKNFRPVRLVGAQRDQGGNYVGGAMVMYPLSRLPDYDLTQYYGTNRGETWNKGTFVINGKTVDYYDWVRRRLAKGDLRVRPLDELKNSLTALCGDLKDRVTSVQTALDAGIDQRPHPDRLPENIFTTSGDWEAYATSSRDARLRSSFVEMMDSVRKMVDRARAGDREIDYNGSNLKRDLLAVYDAESRACKISYRKSDGSSQTLSLDDVRQRLFSLSFDPYLCVERRWGATSAAELRSCRDGRDKQAWFAGEQRLRNQLDRTAEVKMGFSIEELRAKAAGSGVDQAPSVDVRAYLQSVK